MGAGEYFVIHTEVDGSLSMEDIIDIKKALKRTDDYEKCMKISKDLVTYLMINIEKGSAFFENIVNYGLLEAICNNKLLMEDSVLMGIIPVIFGGVKEGLKSDSKDSDEKKMGRRFEKLVDCYLNGSKCISSKAFKILFGYYEESEEEEEKEKEIIKTMLKMLKEEGIALCVKRAIFIYVRRKIESGRRIEEINEILKYAEKLELEGKRNMKNEEYSREEREEWRKLKDEALFLEMIEKRKRDENGKFENISFLEKKRREEKRREKEREDIKSEIEKLKEEEKAIPIQRITSLENISIVNIEGNISKKDNKLLFIKNESPSISFIEEPLTEGVHRMSFKMLNKGNVIFFIKKYEDNINYDNEKKIMSCSFGVAIGKIDESYYFFDFENGEEISVPYNILLDTITIEVDLRSKEPSERTLHVFSGHLQTPIFSSSLPEKVRYAIEFKSEATEIEFVSYEISNYPIAKKKHYDVEIMFDLENIERNLVKERRNNDFSLSSFDDLSSLSSNLLVTNLIILNNNIIHSEEDRWERCIFNYEMKDGVYRLALKIIPCLCGGSLTGLFGLIDSSIEDIEDNVDISKVNGIIKYNSMTGEMINSDNELVGRLEDIPCFGFLTMEVDLRSEEEEKRTLRYFVNGREQELFFTHLPSSVKFILSLKENRSIIEFISLEKLKDSVRRVKEDSKDNEREFKRKRKDEQINSNNSSSSLSELSYYDAYEYKVEGNYIMHLKNSPANTKFIIGDKLMNGAYRLSFKLYGYGGIRFGLSKFINCKCYNSFCLNNEDSAFYSIDSLEDGLINSNSINGYILSPGVDIVTLEVDLRSEKRDERTLHTYVNDKQNRTFTKHLPDEILFSIIIDGIDSKVEFISFEELKEPKVKRNEDEIGLVINSEKEEEEERKKRQKDQKSQRCKTSLSSVPVHLTSDSLIVNSNIVTYTGSEGYETCIIGSVMSEGVYRIAFRVIYSLLYSLSSIGIGLLDSSLGYPENGKSITEVHKGILFDTKTGYMKNIKNKIDGEDFHSSAEGFYAMEVDLRSKDPKKRTLKIFVEGFENNNYFINLPSSVQFAFSLNSEKDKIVFLSLEELSYPTSKKAKGKAIEWGRKLEGSKQYYYPKESRIINSLIPFSLLDFKEVTEGEYLKENNKIIKIKDGFSIGRIIINKEMNRRIYLLKFKIKKMKIFSLFGLTDKNIEDFKKEKICVRESCYYIYKEENKENIFWFYSLDNKFECNNEIEKDLDVWMEIDLSSEDKEKRTVHYIIDGKQQEVFFYDIPDNIKVCLILSSKDDCVEFVSLEEMKEPITFHLRWEQGRKFENDLNFNE